MTMYRVVARLVLSDGTVCGYRLKDMSTGQEGNMDKATAWQYAKAGYIQDVKSTGSIGSGNIGLSGTNGFELKALPSIKKGSTGLLRVSDTKKRTLEVNPDTVKPGWIGIEGRSFSVLDNNAAFIRSLLRGELDSVIKDLGSKPSYAAELRSIKKRNFVNQLNNGEIQQDTFRKCIDKLIVTTALCNGYNAFGGIVVGYEVVNNSNEYFSINRLSKDDIQQDETINLAPGAKAYLNRAEMASLASDVRLSFRFSNAKVVGREDKIAEFADNPCSWSGKYAYLSSNFLQWITGKAPSKVEVKELFDKETVAKYYTPGKNPYGNDIIGTDKTYTVAVEPNVPEAIGDIRKQANSYDLQAALTRSLIYGGVKDNLGTLDYMTKKNFERKLENNDITVFNFRTLSQYVTVTKIMLNNGFYAGAEIVNKSPYPLEVYRSAKFDSNGHQVNKEDIVALEPNKPVLLNREEVARLASDPRIGNQFSNCKLIVTKDLAKDVIQHPTDATLKKKYLRAHFLVDNNGKGIKAQDADLGGAQFVNLNEITEPAGLKEQLEDTLDIKIGYIEVPSGRDTDSNDEGKPKNGIFGMFKR